MMEELGTEEITVLNNSCPIKGYWEFTYLDLNTRKSMGCVSF